MFIMDKAVFPRKLCVSFAEVSRSKLWTCALFLGLCAVKLVTYVMVLLLAVRPPLQYVHPE